MKINYNSKEESAEIHFINDEQYRKEDINEYVTYCYNKDNDWVSVVISDVTRSGIDIVRLTYMDELEIKDYFENYKINN